MAFLWSGPSPPSPGGSPPPWSLVAPRSGPHPLVLTHCPWASSGLQAAVYGPRSLRLKSPQLSFKAPLLLQFFHDFGMAIVITADEKAAAFKGAGADLVFLMDKKQVDEDTQSGAKQSSTGWRYRSTS